MMQKNAASNEEAVQLRLQNSMIGCLQCCPQSCFAFKSLSRDGTMVAACGKVHAAG